MAFGYENELMRELDRLRLTDKERAAIAAAVDFCESTCAPLPRSEQISAIRAFLDRFRETTKTLTVRQGHLRAGEGAQKLFKSGRIRQRSEAANKGGGNYERYE